MNLSKRCSRSQSLRMLVAAAGLLCAASVLADDPPVNAILRPDQPKWDPAARQLTLSGNADVPDGLALTCEIFFGEVVGPRQQTVVKGKKFKIDFPPVEKEKQFLPGRYRFDLTCKVEDQLPAIKEALKDVPKLASSMEVTVGDPEEGNRIRGEIRKSYAKIVQEIHTLYQVMESESSFAVGRVIAARTKAGGKLPETEGKRIMDLWEDFAKRHVDERIRTYHLDFEATRHSCYISPYPEVERGIETLLSLLQKWYAACWVDLARLLETQPPKGTDAPGSFGKRDLLPILVKAGAAVQKALGVEAEDWEMINPFRTEDGDFSGDTYISKTSKFKISCPDGWAFNTDRVHSTVRIRLLPKDEKLANACVVCVELLDYPASEGPKDLDAAIEVNTSERWPGYKKIKGGPIHVSDPNMPDGSRAGFSLLALAISKGVRFRAMEHSLYCRWFKRTYTVVTLCKEEAWDQLEPGITKINNSFVILDKPAPDKGTLPPDKGH